MKKWFVLAVLATVTVGVFAEEGAEKKKGDGKPVTKEMYLANQKKMAEKQGKEFDESKAAKRFDKQDKNKDGKLTGDEKPKKKGKGKGKNKDKKDADSKSEE